MIKKHCDLIEKIRNEEYNGKRLEIIDVWKWDRVIQKIQTFQTVDITIKNNKILFFRAKLIQMCKNFSKIFIFRYCYFTSKFLEESLSKMTHF